MISHLSMLKEVDAKVHVPEQEIIKLANAISDLPPPQRYQPTGLTATHSLAGSVNGSVNGDNTQIAGQYLGRDIQSSQPTVGDAQMADMDRRKLYQALSMTIYQMNPVLEEKISVLQSANQGLRMQIDRMNSSFPYIDEEISEEARWGSMTHWAYVDRESKTKPAANERSRRDAAGANSLAAAAAAIHADDAAASRSEARREAMLAKKHRKEHVDSDFDERPAGKKAHGNKGRKPADPDKSMGLGITNGMGQPKKRRAEKGAPTERNMGSALAQVAGGHGGSPRETPGSDFGPPPKRKKPGPLPGTARKKCVNNPAWSDHDILTAHRPQNALANSPHPASSPLQASFTAGATRPSARARQNSSANVNAERARPASSASQRPTNGSGTPALKPVDLPAPTSIPEETMTGALPPGATTLKHEETEPFPDDAKVDGEDGPAVHLTRGIKGTSKTGTPAIGSFPADSSRPRSTRNNGNGNSSESTNGNGKRSHKKGAASISQQAGTPSGANSRRASVERGPSTAVATENAVAAAPERQSSRPQRNRRSAMHPDDAGDVGEEDDADMEDAPELERDEGTEGDGEGEDGDEPRYCYCNRVSFGIMVGCDNDDCAVQWFHIGCTELDHEPGPDGEFSPASRSFKTFTDEDIESWYCRDCVANGHGA